MCAHLPETFEPLLKKIHARLLASVPPELPVSLRDPIHYFLNLPSKKIRPLMTLFACQVCGGTTEDALPAATAVELFHDFTLIHDDIMDQDELRRGFQTLHVKYDDGTAILVGDALIGLAYQQLMDSPANVLDRVVQMFTEALIKVCEGQALDRDFESTEEVSVDAYLDMIGKKTAWLFQTACSLGAMCANAGADQVGALQKFGYSIGLGFQIQDDLLDFVADEQRLGKKIGSDFRMHKKTYVTLKYREMVQQSPELKKEFPRRAGDFPSFSDFQAALNRLNIVAKAREEAEQFIEQGLNALAEITPPGEENPLFRLTRFLQNRQY